MISPVRFERYIYLGDHAVRYDRLYEIGQGGPEIGHLIIDDKLIEGLQFGGPPFAYERIICIPLWWGNAFIPAVIDLGAREIWRHEQAYSLVLIERVVDTSMRFYSDLDNADLQTVELTDFYLLSTY
jgi:hypothetical protein